MVSLVLLVAGISITSLGAYLALAGIPILGLCSCPAMTSSCPCSGEPLVYGHATDYFGLILALSGAVVVGVSLLSLREEGNVAGKQTALF